MPRCFCTIEAGLGRVGLKVITNGSRSAMFFFIVEVSTFSRGMQRKRLISFLRKD